MTKGKVVQIIGPVVDVEFPAGKLPSILNALNSTSILMSGNRANTLTYQGALHAQDATKAYTLMIQDPARSGRGGQQTEDDQKIGP